MIATHSDITKEQIIEMLVEDEEQESNNSLKYSDPEINKINLSPNTETEVA